MVSQKRLLREEAWHKTGNIPRASIQPPFLLLSEGRNSSTPALLYMEEHEPAKGRELEDLMMRGTGAARFSPSHMYYLYPNSVYLSDWTRGSSMMLQRRGSISARWMDIKAALARLEWVYSFGD
ncbi:hypothetical protein LZ554_004396 [Drepanopeziza brunnea f. sp. 'monogermtubi']|nr:hypothetical protein LZ554_004396 [Drepanopeziza brunnea f. sp. 'monogermtubi']